ncbi:hypothetical protein FJZ31_12195 [Candidatus Poribacteria bacterium]|nr:hypothetical protein [Candidatus Poribacteria bacterium]
MYTKQSLTKVFLIAIALFVFLGGTTEAKNSSSKQADVFDWKSSPLIPTSTVGMTFASFSPGLEQQRWFGVNAFQGSHLGVSLKKAVSFNSNGAETDSASGSGCCLVPTSKFHAGLLGGVLGTIVGWRIGDAIDTWTYCDDCVGIGQFLGFMGGTIIGSSSGVYLHGRSSGEKGSYWATLIGSALGTSGVVLATLATNLVEVQYRKDLNPPIYVFVFLLSDLILPAAAATIGFNLTKGKEQKDSAAINLEEGNISFAFPSLQMQVSQFPNHRPETEYALCLVSAKF